MPKYTVIQLKNFKGGLHLARGLTNSYDKSLDTLHSDTLKSAIFVSALNLYGGEKISEQFFKQFKISSAFPFFFSRSEGRPIYFFPRPETVKLPIQIEGGNDGQEKNLKKIRYIETELFKQILSGVKDIKLTDENIAGSYVSGSALKLRSLLEKENCEAIIRSEPYQHVHLPRDFGQDSEPYFVDKLYFHEQAGLFFLLDTEGLPEVEHQVLSAMKLLADSGIGTDRNTGNGHFEIEIDEIELDVPNTESYQMSLSLYWPTQKEIETCASKSFYGLTKRGGYISSPANVEHLTIRKRSVYMFTEGSIFPYQAARRGRLGDLHPLDFDPLQHPIWRDGQPIFLPINLESHDS